MKSPRPAPASGRVFTLLAATLVAGALCLAPRSAVASDAEFFELIDFANSSLLSNNPSLVPIATELSDPTPDYAAAMTDLVAATPAANYSTSPSRVPVTGASNFAQTFFAWIDLDTPGLGTVKTYVNAANYPAALDAWRDYTVLRLRQLSLPLLYQHPHKADAPQTNLAKMLLGEVTQTDYESSTIYTYEFHDAYGIAGATDQTGNINWIAQPTNSSKDAKASYADFSFASSLVYRYHAGRLLSHQQVGPTSTLTGSGTTATLTFTQPHGLVTGRHIRVWAANPAVYNGVFKVTVINSTQLTYTTASTITSSPAVGGSRRVDAIREPAAIGKWFEVASDFSTRQKTLVSALQLDETPANRTTYRTINEKVDWSVNAQSALSQGDRATELLAAIAILCKVLPEQTLVDRDWHSFSGPVSTTLASGALQLVPAERLARIVMSLMVDTQEALLLRYLKFGAAPNQRLNGLAAIYYNAGVFKEFFGSSALLAQADAALARYADDTFYPDGGMLERSPNYNQIDASAIRYLRAFAASNGGSTSGLDALADRLNDYDLTTAYLQSPLTGLPRIASYVPGNPFRLWDSSTIASWRVEFNKSTFYETSLPAALDVYDSLLDGSTPPPTTTSVAFPYSGQYIMRNGWGTTAHWLYFANTPFGRGHRQMDQNGIQVSAFGRELLSASGPPVYSSSYVHGQQSSHLAGFQNFFGGGSSFKVNTVVVDGRSQNEGGVQNYTTTTTPRENPWFTSDRFDYVEGIYSAGYGGSSYNGISIYNALSGGNNSAITGVTHKRSVLFLRDAGLWFLTDRMSSSSNRTYRQVWTFPARKDPSLSTSPEDLNIGNLVGFLPSEVVASGSTINTTATDGPNIWLHHLGPATPSYTTYSGSTNPYLGWFGYGLNGYRVPAANVHAQFSGSGTRMLVTAIVPRAAGDPGPISGSITAGSLDNSSNVSDKLFTLPGSVAARFTEGVVPQIVPVGNRNITARTVLNLTDSGGVQRGLVIGATNAVANAASSGVVALESFNYTAGTSLTTIGSHSASGWATGWKATADLTTALGADYAVDAGAISQEFTDAPLAPGGHLSRSSNSGGYTIEMYRGLMQPVNLSLDADYFLSFIVKMPTDVSTTGATRAQVRLIDSATPGTINTFFGPAASNLSSNPTKKQVFRGRLLGADFTTTQEAALGKTYLVVVKLRGSSAPGGAKSAWIRAYGPGEAPTEPSSWGSADVTTTATASLSTFGCFVSFYNSLEVPVDELRVGQAWGEVVTPASFEFEATSTSFRVVAPIRIPDSFDGGDLTSIAPPASPSEQWKQLHFGAESTDTAVAGDFADPDRDGLCNLLEYAMGSDPAHPASAPPFSGRVADGTLALGFTRAPAHTDITLAVQGSDDLDGIWTDLASSVAGAPVVALVDGVTVMESGGDSLREVEVRDHVALEHGAQSRRFLRLQVGRTAAL